MDLDISFETMDCIIDLSEDGYMRMSILMMNKSPMLRLLGMLLLMRVKSYTW